ncbi:MAG: hypothetical protein ABSC02_03740 [Acidobacteriota bacterium]
MAGKKKIAPKTLKLIDEALAAIMDQWYLSVSDYYVTTEKKAENPNLQVPEQLKRFHDSSAHRIKFDKGDLDFTYGLALEGDGESMLLEASINNKVPNFNYAELVRRLSVHYESAKIKPIEGFKKLKKVHNADVFSLPDNLQNSLVVEQREGKADIVRLSFGIGDEYLDDLISDPPAFMEVIHQYCVAPLRRIYAEVYRINKRK